MRVLCIDDDWETESFNYNCPKKGNIYTVLAIGIGTYGLIYLLAELPECTWDARGFKPILDDNIGHPCSIDNNKPSHSNAPTIQPVIVGLPGT